MTNGQSSRVAFLRERVAAAETSPHRTTFDVPFRQHQIPLVKIQVPLDFPLYNVLSGRTHRAQSEWVERHGEPVVLDQVAGGRRGRPGGAAGAADHGQPHAAPAVPTCATEPTSGPRNRRPSRPNGSGSPVARNWCTGGGASSSRSRSARVSTR